MALLDLRSLSEIYSFAAADSVAASDTATNILLATAFENVGAGDAAVTILLATAADAVTGSDAALNVLLNAIEASAAADGVLLIALAGSEAVLGSDLVQVLGLQSGEVALGTDLGTVIALRLVMAADSASGAEGQAVFVLVLVLVKVPRSAGAYGLVTPVTGIQTFYQVTPDGAGSGTVLVAPAELARFLRTVAGSIVADPVQAEFYRLANPFVPQIAGPFGGG